MADTIITVLKLMGQRSYVSGVEGASSSLHKLDTTSTQTGRSVQKSGKVSGSALAGIGAVAARVAGPAAIGALVTAGAKVGLGFDSMVESNKIAIGSMLNSQRAGSKLTDQLNTLAQSAEMPSLGLQDFLPAAKQLLGAGVKAKKVVPMLHAVGDAVTVAGGGADTLNRVVTALTQIKGKGKLYAEEFQQIAEAVPGVSRARLAARLGMSPKDFAKAMQAGKISAGKALPAITDVMSKQFQKPAKDMSKSFGSQLAQMQENAKSILGSLFQPVFTGLERYVFPEINKVGQAVQKWAQGGGPGRIFQQAGKYATQFFDAVKPAAPFFKNVLLPIIEGFGQGLIKTLPALGKALKIGMTAIGITAQVLGAIGKAAKPLGPTFKTLGGIMADAFTVPIRMIGFIYDLIRGIPAFMASRLNDVIGAINSVIGVFNKLPGPDIGKIGKVTIPGQKRKPTASNFGVTGVVSGRLAKGGTTRVPGLFEVGERGREIVALPRGARVFPNMPSLDGLIRVENHNHNYLYLDGRSVATSVGKQVADQMARA
jgi:tape measure domain-containing protein